MLAQIPSGEAGILLVHEPDVAEISASRFVNPCYRGAIQVPALTGPWGE